MFPEIVIPSAGIDTSKSKDMFGAGFSPEHAGLFTSRPDNGFAAGFDHAGSDEVPLSTEGSVLHAVDIAGEVEQFLLNRVGPGTSGTFLAGFSKQALDAVFDALSFSLYLHPVHFQVVAQEIDFTIMATVEFPANPGSVAGQALER
jgi:hypothetical protein